MSRNHVRSRVVRTCGVALIASVLLAATPGSSAQPRQEGEEHLPLRAASQAHPLASDRTGPGSSPFAAYWFEKDFP